MRVSAADQSMVFAFDITGKTFRDMGWLPKSWTFTARDVTTTLEFRSLTVSPRPAMAGSTTSSVNGARRDAAVERDREREGDPDQSGCRGPLRSRKLLPEAGGGGCPGEGRRPPEELWEPADRDRRSHRQRRAARGESGALRESRQRGEGVVDVSGRRAGDRISTRGDGQTQPTATNDTARTGRQKNRRVEIRIPERRT